MIPQIPVFCYIYEKRASGAFTDHICCFIIMALLQQAAAVGQSVHMGSDKSVLF